MSSLRSQESLGKTGRSRGASSREGASRGHAGPDGTVSTASLSASNLVGLSYRIKDHLQPRASLSCLSLNMHPSFSTTDGASSSVISSLTTSKGVTSASSAAPPPPRDQSEDFDEYGYFVDFIEPGNDPRDPPPS